MTRVIIIGAGPAGLATAAALTHRGVEPLVLERADTVGPSWHGHYDRLHLHTNRAASGLPHRPMPTSYPQYPSRDQVAAYLVDYAEQERLDVRTGVTVDAVDRVEGRWRVVTDSDELPADHVVIATGMSHTPSVPDYPGLGEFGGTLIHSAAYRNGSEWAGRRSLVVGFGNSAGEIALDLAEHGARSEVSVRSPVVVVPRDILGIPILTISRLLSLFPPRLADLLSKPLLALLVGDITKVGLPAADWGPMEQIATKGKIPLLDVGTMRALRDGRITARPGIERFTTDGVAFVDGTTGTYDLVVMGTGYVPGVDRILADTEGLVDERGYPLVSGGPTAAPGLWFCGFHEPPTGRIREIGIEAVRIAEAITA